MSVISNQNNFFCEHHFIFMGTNLILDAQTLSLPGESTIRHFLQNQVAADWFAEPSLNYSAMMLEPDCPIPPSCTTIPLRQYFWDSKSDYEQNNALTSSLGSLAARAHGFLELRATYRFCPTCGAKLTDDTEFTAKKCTSCGKLLFPRIEPAVIVLVSRGDEILLVKSKTSKTGSFSCVAGFIEHGESAEQCVAREVMEETGITVKNIRYMGSQAWPFPDQLMLAFTAEYQSGELKLQESEIADGGWFKRSNLPPVPLQGSVAYNLIHGLWKN